MSMSRRDFLKVAAKLAAAAGLSGSLEGILGGCASTRKDEITYQNYLPKLEELLNAGKFEQARQLVENSRDIEVPIAKAVLEQLKSEFDHEKEKHSLLFANSEGIIVEAISSPITHSAHTKVFISTEEADEIIRAKEKAGLVFVGAYHHHPYTKEEILKKQKQSDEILPKKVIYEANIPSDDDLYHFKCPEYMSFPDKYLQAHKEKVLLIGGLNHENFQLKIRAYTATHDMKGNCPKINLNQKAQEFYSTLKSNVHQKHDLSHCAEFTIAQK